VPVPNSVDDVVPVPVYLAAADVLPVPVPAGDVVPVPFRSVTWCLSPFTSPFTDIFISILINPAARRVNGLLRQDIPR